MPERSPASLVAGGLNKWSEQTGYQEGAGATQGSVQCALESLFVSVLARFNSTADLLFFFFNL